jgi:hypothetical protein
MVYSIIESISIIDIGENHMMVAIAIDISV